MLTAQDIRERAVALGFDAIGFAPVGEAPRAQAFVDWLAAGHHGEMAYLARPDAVAKRLDPRQVLAGARTVVMVGVSYETLAVPGEALRDPSRGRIARYAWGIDYHDALTPLLRDFGAWLARESRAYVDTGPVLERGWAERCGLGFIGRNTCLIDRARGSFLFLGAVLVAAEIHDPEVGGVRSPVACGACTRCLAACPTGAFPRAGVLDARRCISYLTIELKGGIPADLRPRLGNWIFGCDICQDVCPYVRRFSAPSPGPLGARFRPEHLDRAAPRLSDVLGWDQAAFNARFRGSAVARAKRRGLIRNACVAAGNSGDQSLLPQLRNLRAADPEPLVREHAAWAIEHLSK